MVLNAAWLVSSRACIRALRSGRRPGPVPLALAASAVAYHGYLRPRMHRWGATEEERMAVLPGDEADADPGEQTTRGLTIDAPVEDVWPWLAQIGQDRAGFYSYTILENLAGCRMRTADAINPEWQHREVGEEVPLHPSVRLRVRVFDPPHALALEGWSLVLRPLPDGRTRLLARGQTPGGPARVAYGALLELPHFVMERKMMLGIKERAERARNA